VCVCCKQQNERICGEPNKRKLALDHCHATGKLRGFICHQCNTAIGMLGECQTTISLVSEYIAERCALNAHARRTKRRKRSLSQLQMF
jgi:hypothetical protein